MSGTQRDFLALLTTTKGRKLTPFDRKGNQIPKRFSNLCSQSCKWQGYALNDPVPGQPQTRADCRHDPRLSVQQSLKPRVGSFSNACGGEPPGQQTDTSEAGWRRCRRTGAPRLRLPQPMGALDPPAGRTGDILFLLPSKSTPDARQTHNTGLAALTWLPSSIYIHPCKRTRALWTHTLPGAQGASVPFMGSQALLHARL